MNVSFFRDMAFATRYAGPTRFLRTFFCKADAKTDCDTLWLVYVERVVAVVASLSILLSPHSSEALSPIETVKVVLHLIPPRSISFSAVAPLKKQRRRSHSSSHTSRSTFLTLYRTLGPNVSYTRSSVGFV